MMLSLIVSLLIYSLLKIFELVTPNEFPYFGKELSNNNIVINKSIVVISKYYARFMVIHSYFSMILVGCNIIS